MKKCKVKIEPEALTDIQNITDWYNAAKKGLGKRSQDTAVKQINSLNKDPHIYAPVQTNPVHSRKVVPVHAAFLH